MAVKTKGHPLSLSLFHPYLPTVESSNKGHIQDN